MKLVEEVRQVVTQVLDEKEAVGGLTNVVWVAAGGSNGGNYPTQYFMEHEATALTSHTYTSNEFVRITPKVKQLKENIIMIFGSVHDLATFAQAHPEIAEVNYGATANRAGATQLDQSVFLLPSEIEDTRAILAAGVKIYSQQTPSHTRTDITSI